MTSPPEMVTVPCPGCGCRYETPFRGSMNLSLDSFDAAYIEDMSTGVCPECGHRVGLGALVVTEDGRWELP